MAQVGSLVAGKVGGMHLEDSQAGVQTSGTECPLETSLVSGGCTPKANAAEGGEKVMLECRICQGDDELANLVEPCSCSGHLQYAHFSCVQHWIDVSPRADRGVCEVCRQPYKVDFKILEHPPIGQVETQAQMRQRLFQIVCSSYLRVLVGIERPNDRLVLEHLAPMFEYIPGTDELTQWAMERIRTERTLSYKFKSWWKKVKTRYSLQNRRSTRAGPPSAESQ